MSQLTIYCQETNDHAPPTSIMKPLFVVSALTLSSALAASIRRDRTSAEWDGIYGDVAESSPILHEEKGRAFFGWFHADDGDGSMPVSSFAARKTAAPDVECYDCENTSPCEDGSPGFFARCDLPR